MSKSTPESLAAKRAQYDQRKADRRCVCCNAGLQDLDGVRCVECHEIAARARAKSRQRDPDGYRRRDAERTARRRALNPEAWNARQRERRLEHKINGLCSDCNEPALEDNVRCQFHRARSIESWHHNAAKRRAA